MLVLNEIKIYIHLQMQKVIINYASDVTMIYE